MRILIPLLALLLHTASVAAGELDVIDLHNRPAEEIIPLIKPMLHAGESVNGQGFQLILKADAARQTQIRELVSKLDRAAAQLMISVFQGSERDLQALGVDVDLRIDSDTASGEGSQAQASGTVIGTRTRMQDNPVHRLRVTEGTAGYIETGKSIPYFSGSVYQRDGQQIVESAVSYKDVTSGFFVRPRVNGDQVILDISPHRDALDEAGAGAINTRSAATTVSGALGQWMPLGGTTAQIKRSSRQPGKHYSTQDRHSESIWIKAEKVQ